MENEKSIAAQNGAETSIFEDETYLEPATTGMRFANYLIDAITFLIFMFILGIVGALVYPPFIDFMDSLSTYPGLDRLFSLVIYGIYMGAVEAIFHGKTLGRLITGTRTVNYDGAPITAKQGFLRGLSRAVPFEAFSIMGDGMWHDKWTNTVVIITKKSVLPNS